MQSNKKMYNLLLGVFAVFFLSACQKEDPNPELRDKIYLDLKQDYEAEQAAYDETKKYRKESLEKYMSSKPHSVERVAALKDIKKRKAAMVIMDKKLRYLKIRTEKRRLLARRAYKKARIDGTKWPDPDEYRYYMVNKKLVNANMNWQARVPKLFKGNPNYKPK